MIRIGMILGERYEILEKIGTGGMSDVYKAKCHKLNRFVAVKVLKQEFSENANFVSKFRVEAQAAAGLMHPNIVSVYDVGEEDGIHYIVMELVEGITLKNYIEKKARLSLKEAISIAIQVSMGIEAAHNNHIIHRDIKPQNIIISREGKVKVTDFGIAKAATSNTITSNVMGSVHYTSPEQARGGFSDAKSDIYSLGCTMFEMLTGRVPFDGETTVAIAIKHIQEDMPSCREFVPEIPVSVENIIFKATQKSPDRRYQSMGELIVDLKKSLLTPEEDFVKVIPVDSNGATRIITEEDMEEIKGRTIDLPLEKPVEKRAEKPVGKVKPILFEREEDEDDEDEEEENEDVDITDDEEFEDDDLDPKMERVTTILAIVAAVIIGVIVLVLVANAVGLFKGAGSKKEKTATEETAQVEMIDVVGKDLETAQKELNDLGLGTRVTTQEDETVPENAVISQDVKKGTMVDKYTTINLMVSSGSDAIEIPDVSGKSLEDATSALEDAGFKVSQKTESSDKVDKDKVTRTEPAGGEKMAAESNITIYVSSGPEVVEVKVPSLVGMTESAAKAKLEEVNLKAGTVSEENSSTVTTGCVISQNVASGTSVEEGTSVDFVLSIGAKETTYSYSATIAAPTGYNNEDVTVYITGVDGDKRTITTKLPGPVNEKNFKCTGGTLYYQYTTSIVGEDGTTKTETRTSQTINISFTPQ